MTARVSKWQRATPWLNLVIAVLYAAVAVLYFTDGRAGYGWLWLALTGVWLLVTGLSVATLRSQIRTARIADAISKSRTPEDGAS